jgi:predicted TIM-barrel fold metal-dependent hydrolase
MSRASQPSNRVLSAAVNSSGRLGCGATKRGHRLKNHKTILLSILALTGMVAVGVKWSRYSIASPSSQSADLQFDPALSADLRSLASVHPIDAHAHVFQDSPAFYAMLKQLNMRVVNICVVDRHDVPFYRTVGPQFRMAMTINHHSQGRAAVCTTFNPYKFESPHFAAQAVTQLDENFREGAVAVKIWKNIGMELKWPSGKYVMPDDAIFKPIYQDIAAHNKTLIAHIAEPDSCWQPLSAMGLNNPDYGYYKKYPFWHMYGKPHAPSKAEILAARDRMVAENPHLHIIGAHLGSLEGNVDEIAKRFDRYPNFAVDTAARVHYLMAQPRENVRAFMIKYQDRILYGTDGGIHPEGDPSSSLQQWQYRFAMHWRYFATDETFEFRGQQVQGLKLPAPVLRKLYHDNAVRWIPGLLNSQ